MSMLPAWNSRHSRPDLQQDICRLGRLPSAVLRQGLPDEGEGPRRKMQLPLRVVLQGALRDMSFEEGPSRL
ncbi:hypothetical protein EVAR_74989_1 [Eumeta japonica]|uniref:Uncharacterized protein n=1 Tax=Eumeta variegata TaxID=151549 RepID=A0A4C1VCJ8_EUMVA|nr:hypothetical protein EVAR_74989_1 [Eumeta japonica]